VDNRAVGFLRRGKKRGEIFVVEAGVSDKRAPGNMLHQATSGSLSNRQTTVFLGPAGALLVSGRLPAGSRFAVFCGMIEQLCTAATAHGTAALMAHAG